MILTLIPVGGIGVFCAEIEFGDKIFEFSE